MPTQKKIIRIHIEKGACHDFYLYQKTELRIHFKIKQKADSGYQEAQQLHPNTDLLKKGSKNKPFTKEQKKKIVHLPYLLINVIDVLTIVNQIFRHL